MSTKDISVIQSDEILFKINCQRSEIFAKSSLIPVSLRGKPADILVIMMMAQELNIPPMQALNGINAIQGKAVISPQLMIALIRSRLPNSYINIVEGEGVCHCTMSRDKNDKEQEYTAKWDLIRAREMGLVTKDNWKKQAATMLKWRAVGDAARVVFPDILSGLYFPDEFQDGTLNINENGELIEIPKEIQKPIEKIIPKDDPLTEKIKELIKKLTNDYKNKEKLNKLLIELSITKSQEIPALSEESKLEIIAALEQKISDESFRGAN